MSVYVGSKKPEPMTPEQIEKLRRQAKEGPHPKLAALVLSAFNIQVAEPTEDK